MTALVAEFIGTAVLVLLGNGVVANVVLPKTYGNNGGVIAITWAWAMAVFVGVIISGNSSGAHINPAVTIGLSVAGLFEWSHALGYISAQLAGGIFGGALVFFIYRSHYEASDDPDAKRATFCTSPAIPNTARNLLSEIIGTFVLIYAIYHITGAKVGDTHASLGSLDALPVALVVLGIGLSLGGTTGYAINPARDLGPRIAHYLLPIPSKGSSNWSYSWIPVVGPILGALIAAAVFMSIG